MRGELPFYPGALDVELSSACNLKCPMCPRSQPGFGENRKRIGHMDDAVFRHIYEELSAHSGRVKWIWLHVGGESLLDPQFVERANLLTETGAYTAVSTNATPLTDELAKAVLGSELGRLVLSIDGATKETYEACRPGADFDDVMAKVESLLERAKRMEKKGERHPEIWLQCLRMDDTKDELLAFAQRWGEGKLKKYQRLRGIEHGKVFLKNHESWASQVEPRGEGWDRASGRGRRFTCRKPFGRTTILSDGSVSICCYDIQARCVVGSLRDNSLGGAWRSAAMEKIRAGFIAAQSSPKRERGFSEISDLFPELCRGC